MYLKNSTYEISIVVDSTYTVDSADNKYYDFTLNPQNKQHNDRYSTLNITISSESDKFSIALIGNSVSYAENCALLDGNILTVLQDNAISQIDCSTGSLLFYKNLKCYGNNWEIHRIPNGYLIYGEIEIIMLDLEFHTKWAFSGKDTFVSPFEIRSDRICLYDYENNYYELDFNGSLQPSTAV